MGYADYADTRHDSVPFELFKFQWGDSEDDCFTYTDAERPISIGTGGDALVYTPTPVSRSTIKSTVGFKGNIDISVPVKSSLADLYKGLPPSLQTRVTIYRGQLADATKEVKLVWLGAIVSYTFKGSEAIFRCELDASTIKRVGLRTHYQHTCPHMLYGNACRASKAAATRSTTVSSISGATLGLPSGWSSGSDAAKFAGGFIYYERPSGQPERIAILSASDSETLLLANVPPTLVAGMNVDVVLGCNHTIPDCSLLHSNVQNFGGCWQIPTDNPIGLKNNFY